MRLVFDVLILLMLAALLGAVVWVQHERHTEQQRIARVHDALAALSEGMRYEAAMRQAIDGVDGFPRAISPRWFPSGLPTNHLLPAEHPWIDVAPEGDRAEHPPDPIVDSAMQAGFWYNPSRGIFRARVPAQLSEAASIDLYNKVNHTDLDAAPDRDEMARRPEPNWPDGEEGKRLVPVNDPAASDPARNAHRDRDGQNTERRRSAEPQDPDAAEQPEPTTRPSRMRPAGSDRNGDDQRKNDRPRPRRPGGLSG